jgi:hypothetical protein
MATRRSGMDTLLLELGIKNLTDFVIGCAYVAGAMDVLSFEDRTALHARLAECLKDTDGKMSQMTKLPMEVIANNLSKLNSNNMTPSCTSDGLRHTVPKNQVRLHLDAQRIRRVYVARQLRNGTKPK